MLPLTDQQTKKLRTQLVILFTQQDTGDLLMRYIFNRRPSPNPNGDLAKLQYDLGSLHERLRVMEDIYGLMQTSKED
jgi:hypothetical protein